MEDIFHVIECSAAAAQADTDEVILKNDRELIARELRTLVIVEYIRHSSLQSRFQHVHTEVHIERDRNRPGHHITAVLVHDHCKLNH